jgi:hypothetical protein
MSKISLNPRSCDHRPLRDDAYLTLTVAQFYLLRKHSTQYRLTTASSAELIKAGIILKRGWQGIRLDRLSTGADRNDKRPIWVDTVIFETKANEIPNWNSANDDDLKAAWYEAQNGCRPIRDYDEIPVSCFRHDPSVWWA